MAREVVERVISDLSGKEIPPGREWQMTLTPPDGRKNPVRLDITEEEAQQWLKKGTEIKRRGRRPGTIVASAQLPAGQRAAPTRRRRGAAKEGAATRRGRKTTTRVRTAAV
jgi:hypothetical protein